MEYAFRWFLLFVVFGHCGMGLLAFVHVHASFGVRNPSTIWNPVYINAFPALLFLYRDYRIKKCGNPFPVAMIHY